MKQTGKVKWVAMPAAQTTQTPHPPPSCSSSSAATAVPQTAASATKADVMPTPDSASPAAAAGAAQETPPARRAPTPAPRAGSPVPRPLSAVPRAVTPVSRTVPRPVTPAPRTGGSSGTGSPAVSPRQQQSRPASDSDNASWGTPGSQSPVPTPSSAPAPAPALTPFPTSTGGVPALLPALNLPPAAYPPAAFNARITELKTLIDRAIEETREFLGRSRGSPRAAPLVSVESATVTPASPRPSLSPTIVDIAVRRPTGTWELAAAEAQDSPRSGSARSSPRRGAVRGSSVAAAGVAGRTEPLRLTELVGLQGRRFLPQLNGTEPPPSPSRSR